MNWTARSATPRTNRHHEDLGRVRRHHGGSRTSWLLRLRRGRGSALAKESWRSSSSTAHPIAPSWRHPSGTSSPGSSGCHFVQHALIGGLVGAASSRPGPGSSRGLLTISSSVVVAPCSVGWLVSSPHSSPFGRRGPSRHKVFKRLQLSPRELCGWPTARTTPKNRWDHRLGLVAGGVNSSFCWTAGWFSCNRRNVHRHHARRLAHCADHGDAHHEDQAMEGFCAETASDRDVRDAAFRFACHDHVIAVMGGMEWARVERASAVAG